MVVHGELGRNWDTDVWVHPHTGSTMYVPMNESISGGLESEKRKQSSVFISLMTQRVGGGGTTSDATTLFGYLRVSR